ncbi:MAG: ABC transporter permease subunit [Steroidobacteraceae bacterium]
MKQRWGDYLMLIIGLAVLWQLAYYFAGPDAIAPPWQTLQRLAIIVRQEPFWENARATGSAFLYAAVLALTGGLVIGIAIGSSAAAHEILSPILETLYSIPKIVLYPVILLVFGLGPPAKIAFGALHGFFPVTLFAIGAIRNIQPVLLRTARVMRLAPLSLARHILLPAALPEIVTGLRIGFSTTLLGTLIGELFASSQGLGFMLIHAMDSHNVPDIMALTFLLFLVATCANAIILAIEHHVRAHAA